MGGTAGGESTCLQLTSPAAAGLFHRAIVQSGPCTAATSWSREEAEQRSTALAAKVGCGDAATAGECLRATPVADLLAATGPFDAAAPVADGELIPLDPVAALAAGRFHQVPVLHGMTHDEERLMVGGEELAPGAHPLTGAEYQLRVVANFGEHAARVLTEYPVGDYDAPGLALATVQTDHHWAKPVIETNTVLAKYVPTFAYEFADQQAPWFPGLAKPSFPPGAYHAAELPYLLDVDFAERLTTRQRRLGDAMIDYWTRFARTGNPNGCHAPHWPQFRGDRQHVQSLASGSGGIRPTDFARDHRYAFWSSTNNQSRPQ